MHGRFPINNHNYVKFYWKWKFDNWPANFNWYSSDKKQACPSLHNVQSAPNGQDCYFSILSLEAHIPLSFIWCEWKADFSLVHFQSDYLSSLPWWMWDFAGSLHLCPSPKDEHWQLCCCILWKIKHSFSFYPPVMHSGFIERCDSWGRQAQV